MISKYDIKYLFETPDLMLLEKGNLVYVILRKNYKLALVEKVNPKNTNELVVSYYDNNKLCYEIITTKDILPIDKYEAIKERFNNLNKLLK